MITITLVAGARPNFVKIAPIIRAIENFNSRKLRLKYRLVHTGQHYDTALSKSFFEQLDIPEPDANLSCGGGTQAEQTARIMVRFERDLIENPTNLVLVVGDVTSTLACSITAKKLNIPVVHVEAGIRSGDLAMPEEINRMVTDSITDHFFTTSEYANENLRNSGVPQKRIHFVGNTMIDTLLANQHRLINPNIVLNGKPLSKKFYYVLTLHRPRNVDQKKDLNTFINAILEGAIPDPVIFPVHPRTRKTLQKLGISNPRLKLIDPLPYLEFNYLVKNAKGIITDSGGITEEASVQGVPCLTVRDNTERRETITLGTNELVGTDPENIILSIRKVQEGQWKKGGPIPLWDGKASERIISTLWRIYG